MDEFPKARGKSTTAPGSRTYTMGELYTIGIYGFSWSSDTNGTNGVYLDFKPGYLNTTSAHPRGHGFQLRCLSE